MPLLLLIIFEEFFDKRVKPIKEDYKSEEITRLILEKVLDIKFFCITNITKKIEVWKEFYSSVFSDTTQTV